MSSIIVILYNDWLTSDEMFSNCIHDCREQVYKQLNHVRVSVNQHSYPLILLMIILLL